MAHMPDILTVLSYNHTIDETATSLYWLSAGKISKGCSPGRNALYVFVGGSLFAKVGAGHGK